MTQILKTGLGVLIGAALLGIGGQATAAGFLHKPGANQLVDQLAAQGIPAKTTRRLLNAARKQPGVIDKIKNPAEKRLNWGQYRAIFMQPSRVRQGAAFIQAHQTVFKQAQRHYGVPAPVIAAIIGVETRYGQHMGHDRVLDALATLGFDYPPRSQFFRRELRSFIELCVKNDLNCEKLKGSYAGAIGMPQFIPSSYVAYAVDGNGDGKRNLWQPADAIVSVASYLSRHHWQQGAGVATSVRIPDGSSDTNLARARPGQTNTSWRHLARQGARASKPPDGNTRVALLRLQGQNGREYWLAEHNFFVITTYNHSDLYAMAVHQLAQAIAKRLN